MKIVALSVAFLLVGCGQASYQRFIPFREGNGLALDTRTGRQCYTIPKTDDMVTQIREAKAVFCEDLYRADK